MDDAGLPGPTSPFAELAALTAQQIWDGVVGRAVHGERLTLAVVELAPGAVIPEHSHENEQAGILISGSLTFRVGEESRDLRAGGAWCVPPGAPHEIHVGDDGAIVVETFAPPRADWEALERLPGHEPRWPR